MPSLQSSTLESNTRTEERISIASFLPDEESAAELREIRAGLLRQPPEISPRYLYDDRGAHLFERICATPEYYQTRSEGALLARLADEIVALSGAEELLEIGSGAATKTQILLDAMERAGRLRLYLPFDVHENGILRVAEDLTARYTWLRVQGVVGDFTRHLDRIPPGKRRLAIFLGGTIGNFAPAEATAFLAELAAAIGPGDHLLLGTDLIKDTARLEAAYNDAQGITAAFNKNVLQVLNRLLGADFDPGAFAHRAFFNRVEHRIEMRLRALRDQRVDLPALGLQLALARGREILTEISVKFDRELVEAMLAASGFELRRWYTDPQGLFALTLARRIQPRPEPRRRSRDGGAVAVAGLRPLPGITA